MAALLGLSHDGSAQTLRLVTLNIWSGLEYSGFFAFGEVEPGEQRDRRFRLLVDELRRLDPDVIALQEVNPVYDKAEVLAAALGYNSLYLRGNAGIKFGGLGIPWNLNEGLVILARRDLELQLVSGEDFSSGFGTTGNTFAFHFSGRPMGLAVRVRKEGVEVVIVNVHLGSMLPADPEVKEMVPSATGAGNAAAQAALLRRLEEGHRSQLEEADALREFVGALAPGTPTIVVGDLNATPDSPELTALRNELGLQDVALRLPAERSSTWDPIHNPNTAASTEPWSSKRAEEDPYDLLSSWYDTKPRRIDYILLSRHFGEAGVRSVTRCFDREVLGTYVSDHYALMAELDLSGLPKTERRATPSDAPAGLDILPIASYDTDVGFGLGVKTFALNTFGASESIDLMAFASTGGERLVRMVFSIPDFELRQGTVYPLSFDLVAEYDKYLKNSFFGIGNTSTFDQRETYSKEPLEISALFGRGIARTFVVQVGVKYKIVRNFNYADTSLFAKTPPSLNQGTSAGLSIVGSARYDSRSSFIHPDRGEVVQFDVGYGTKSMWGDYDLFTTSLSLQGYRPFISPRTILAVRLSGQIAAGDSLPVHTLSVLGGSKTMRGYPLDRYLDNVRILSTIELRFPLVWRVGAVAGIDAGKVWDRPSAIDFRRWAWNGVFGLRFYFDSFVARADLGISREYTGFYLDFGHSF